MKLKLIFLLFIALGTLQLSAQERASVIVEKALTQAKAENKSVFIKYSASWCGWCKRMDRQMKSDDCKPLFDANYVIVDLVVLESKKNKHLEHPGAFELLKKHNGERSGLPFWIILDKNGKLTGSSLNAQQKNIGCPATQEEVAAFITVLKKTSALTDENLAVIAGTFRKKE